MSDLTIDFSTLPKEIISKIPLSLRVFGNVHVIKDLPIKIQYLVKKYINPLDVNLNYSDVYDLKPQISIYSDLQVIYDLKEIIKYYLSNYLSIRTGSYPFDAAFGCKLKDQLQTRDTSLRSTLIGNEIGLISGIIGQDYNVDITIEKISVNTVNFTSHVEYEAEIQLKIGQNKFTITV